MKSIMVSWELGGGLGHVANLRPIVEELVDRGHQVTVVAKNVSLSRSVLGDDIPHISAPKLSVRPNRVMRPTWTFSQVLYNEGLAEFASLSAGVAQWREIFRQVEPDVIIFDHSPTALLGARSVHARRAVFGVGFCCPASPRLFPNWHPHPRNIASFEEVEERILQTANQVMSTVRAAPLNSLADLYAEVDQTHLITYPELDPFAPRSQSDYLGIMPPQRSSLPQWPPIEGRRIFAYMRPMPALIPLLRVLNRWRLPTIAFVPSLGRQLVERFQSDSLRFSEQPVDIQTVARDCDVFIGYGSHSTTAAMLLAGKPVMLFPIDMEKELIASAVTSMGAGRWASPNAPREGVERLREILLDRSHHDAAERFAHKHERLCPLESAAKIVERIENLLRID